MKKALVVGINYKNDRTISLNGCINDIIDVSDLLTTIYGYNHIVQLRDDSPEPNKQPTRKNILNELFNLVANSNPEDEIWFHYSGHGSQTICVHGDRTKTNHMDEVIVPLDFRQQGFIFDDEIFNIIKNSKCKTMMIFDCCHSASVCELHWMFDCEDGKSVIKTINTVKEIENPNIFSISGCKNEQTSADASCKEHQSIGAFTDSMIHVLKNANYNIDLMDLYTGICSRIKSDGFEQIPILCSSSMTPSFIFTRV